MIYEYITRYAIQNSIMRSCKSDKKYLKTRERNVLRDCLLSVDGIMDNKDSRIENMDVPNLCHHMESKLNTLQPIVDYVVEELYDWYINRKTQYYGGRVLCGIRYFKPKDFKTHIEKMNEFVRKQFFKTITNEINSICFRIFDDIQSKNVSCGINGNETVRDIALIYRRNLNNAIINQVFPQYYIRHWFSESRYKETLNHVLVHALDSFENLFISGYKDTIVDVLLAYNLRVDFSDFRMYHVDAYEKEKAIANMIVSYKDSVIIKRKLDHYSSEIKELCDMSLNHDPRRIINRVKLKAGISNGN